MEEGSDTLALGFSRLEKRYIRAATLRLTDAKSGGGRGLVLFS